MRVFDDTLFTKIAFDTSSTGADYDSIVQNSLTITLTSMKAKPRKKPWSL
jgi:hypothetical protein